MGDVRTIGVEEELHVVDLRTGRLSAKASQLLRGLPEIGFSAELQRTTVETNTDVCQSLTDLRRELVRLRTMVDAVALADGLGVAATGSAPLSAVGDFELTTQGRFSRMQQDYRILVDDQLICGLQVHVGVDDRDVAVRVAQRVSSDLPTLLAMSASSPYWNAADTGYASFRTMIWQRWPTAGSLGYAENAQDYDDLVADLIESGVIADAKMAYFDVRPSAHVPTVELRVCDACPIIDDAVLIAGLFRALVAEAAAADASGADLRGRPEPVHRAAMWRAARSGLSGPLLGPDAAPQPAPAADVVRALVDRLRPHLEEAGDWNEVRELSSTLLAHGNSSTRQRDRFAERGKLTDVVALVLTETRGQAPLPPVRPVLTTDYPETGDDEALAGSGVPYPGYRPVFDLLGALGLDELHQRAVTARKRAAAEGLTYGVAGQQRAFHVDLVPRIVAPHEWSILAAGLIQRARAIEMFLRDIYGPARIVDDRVLDWETVHDGPGWDPAARLLPNDVMRAPIIGFDLVKDSLSGWRVLEDNTRVPSGVGYAIAVRRLMNEALPELRADTALRDPASALQLIGETLRAVAGRHDPVIALLSDGADNSAWYEHQMIANAAGFLLVQPDEIEVEGARVRAGGRRVDLLYLRLGVELADLRDSAGERIGERIVAAAQDGTVRLANAPGSGVADDKAMYCLVPDFINYYLGERPLIAPVPTYRCANPTERDLVLGRLNELVSKPVDGYGGSGVLVGPDAAAAEIDTRRREIEADPRGWIAQEVVALSTHPVLGERRFEPRHVDLRAFVCLSGIAPGQARLADVALTRVAPAGSMVVNSSRGGGAKDTWIIADPNDEGR